MRRRRDREVGPPSKRSRGELLQRAAVAKETRVSIPRGEHPVERAIRLLLGDTTPCLDGAVPPESGVSCLGLVYGTPRVTEAMRRKLHLEWYNVAMPVGFSGVPELHDTAVTFHARMRNLFTASRPPRWDTVGDVFDKYATWWWQQVTNEASAIQHPLHPGYGVVLRGRHSGCVIARGGDDDLVRIYKHASMRRWCAAVRQATGRLPDELLEAILEFVNPLEIATRESTPGEWGAVALYRPGRNAARAVLGEHLPVTRRLLADLYETEERLRGVGVTMSGGVAWA